VRGELLVEPLTDDPNRFAELKRVLLETDPVVEVEIESVARHQARILLRLKGINNRNQAKELVGKYLSVTREELANLPDDTYFHFELIGMEVYSDQGVGLGRITEILNMPANDVWVIVGEKELLLPATKEFVVSVDREKRRVTVKMIEGLLE
jgi:16S rRNA processing protein RimM